jgi:uncharacterized membrane protein
MRSRAAIAGHPLHPAVVAVPIGAFTVTLVADLVRLAGHDPAWGDTARGALLVGIAGALLAAVLGFIDYFAVTMSEAGFRVARRHMILNLIGVALFATSYWLRHTAPEGWSVAGFATSTLALMIAGVAGWLGGELAFKHKVGVVEGADREATALGQKEAS